MKWIRLFISKSLNFLASFGILETVPRPKLNTCNLQRRPLPPPPALIPFPRELPPHTRDVGNRARQRTQVVQF